MRKRFRKVYLINPVKNYDILYDYCDDIRFITSGVEKIGDVIKAIPAMLASFDPREDAIVATGKSNIILYTGMVIRTLQPEARIWVGIYQSQNLHQPRYDWIQL